MHMNVSELDIMGITCEASRSQYLHASISGEARKEMLQIFHDVPALATEVRNDSASFTDYASAMHACIPVALTLF